MMRVTPTTLAVPFLILLLTWLSVRALNPEAELFDRALAELDHFEMLENGLYRDVLAARAGILRNYDPRRLRRLVNERLAADEVQIVPHYDRSDLVGQTVGKAILLRVALEDPEGHRQLLIFARLTAFSGAARLPKECPNLLDTVSR